MEIKDTDLAWLAGLWDGEGSITIFTHTEKNGRKKICPTLIVVNTDDKIIARAAEILDALGTSFALFERTPSNPKHKRAKSLSTRNRAYIKTVLDAILPYLVGKRPQAVLTLRYVNKKIAAGNQRQRYDEEDRELQQQVQAMNATGVPILND